jgi:hypothetical protein
VAPALNNAGRNLLHNAQFNVAQRGAGPWTADSLYTVDRWTTSIGLDTASFSRVALTDADRTGIADEAATGALQNVFTGNAGAGSYNFITQWIEGVRRLAGKTVTVSFWAKAASGTPKIGVNSMQKFGTGGSPSPIIWALATGMAVTIGTTWARYSVQIALPSATGKTLGTNGDDCTSLSLWFSSGTTQGATAGNIGVQSGTIQLWGVQLEVGASATPLEKLEYADDLRHCQRFYQTGAIQLNAYGTAAMGLVASTMLPVPMRSQPTVAPNGSLTYVNSSGGSFGFLGNSMVTLSFTATAVGLAACVGPFTASADL